MTRVPGRNLISCVFLLWQTAALGAGAETIIRYDFENCQPATAISERHEPGKWWLRHVTWADQGGVYLCSDADAKLPDLVYDPGLEGTFDIWVGMRCVDFPRAIALRLSNEKKFEVVDPGPGLPNRHWNKPVLWRTKVKMAGKTIYIRHVSQNAYLDYFCFIKSSSKSRLPVKRFDILRRKGKHFAFPGITRCKNGDILVAAREGIDHVDPFGKIVLVRSTDGGATWSRKTVVFDSPLDDRDPGITTLDDGTILLTCNRSLYFTQLRQWEKQAKKLSPEMRGQVGPCLLRSQDNGKTWSAPSPIPVHCVHGPIEAKDGTLYIVGLRTREKDRREVVIYRSKDKGRSWTFHASVAVGSNAARRHQEKFYDEPNLCILNNGTWIVVTRVEYNGFLHVATSKDEGRTWSPMRETPMWGWPAHLLQLSDGRLLCAYGYRRLPMGARACWSEDFGKTWSIEKEIVLRTGGTNADLGYPMSIELDDGSVLTVCYFNDGVDNATGRPSCYIVGQIYRLPPNNKQRRDE